MLTIPESHLELARRPHGCAITTIAPSGLPQTTGMWFLYTDDTIKFSLLSHRKKFHNLKANPACTFFLMDPKSMSNTIEVRGNATLEPDPGKKFVTRVRAHYGAEGPPKDGPNDDRYVVTIEASTINILGRG